MRTKAEPEGRMMVRSQRQSCISEASAGQANSGNLMEPVVKMVTMGWARHPMVTRDEVPKKFQLMFEEVALLHVQREVCLGKAVPLLGREWLRRIRLDWGEIKTVREVHHINEGTPDSLLKSKATPSMAAARLQRWALLPAAHNYTIQYRSAKNHGNADGLSRLPLPVQHRDSKDAMDGCTSSL
ncbi:hypothetical protein QQF64_006315 [Cirrhinus molitorella]|uniref:Uncharacterized protein n=1 Tax=Cirrhinus molitorella TaxID=172907 RepID=A0ABR3MGW6_9TELE